jgi:hypothetical protein
LKVNKRSSLAGNTGFDFEDESLSWDLVLLNCFRVDLEGVKKSEGSFFETRIRVPAE